VTITDNAEDVIARKIGVPDLGIECKQPASLNGIPRNLARLKKQVARTSCPLAVAIIGADRVAGLAGSLYKASNEGEVIRALESMTQHVISLIRRNCARARYALAPKAPVGVVITVGGTYLTETSQIYHFARFQPFPTAGEDRAAEMIRTSLLENTGRLEAYDP
jgi:hypothetical protein